MVRGLDGADMAAEQHGDLAFGEVLVVPEREHRALAERKAAQREPRLVERWLGLGRAGRRRELVRLDTRPAEP